MHLLRLSALFIMINTVTDYAYHPLIRLNGDTKCIWPHYPIWKTLWLGSQDLHDVPNLLFLLLPSPFYAWSWCLSVPRSVLCPSLFPNFITSLCDALSNCSQTSTSPLPLTRLFIANHWRWQAVLPWGQSMHSYSIWLTLTKEMWTGQVNVNEE